GVVDQHIDRPMLALGFGESGDGGVPVGDVAHRRIERIAVRLLLVEPLLIVAARAASGNHLESITVQALADRSADASHAAGHVCHFLCHVELQSLVGPDPFTMAVASALRSSGKPGPARHTTALDTAW